MPFSSLNLLDQEKMFNFSQLKNLSLILGDGSILWGKCLEGICCVSQFEGLELQIGKLAKNITKISFSEKLLNLKSFHLKLDSLPTYIEILLLNVSKLPLKVFSLDLSKMENSFLAIRLLRNVSITLLA